MTVKKLKVWLNNKLNKYLHCTVVIKFYRIFVTELVFTFFIFRYKNHFEFPKEGIKAKSLFKNSGNSWGEEGESSKTPWNRKSWGGGGGMQNKESSLVGVWIFSGTTHFKLNPLWKKKGGTKSILEDP